MKKIFTILSIVLLGAVACNKSNIDTPEPENSGLVEVNFSLSLPSWLVAETKAGGAMGHLPDINDIRVAMFGTSDYPQAYTKAVPVDADGNLLDSYATDNYDPKTGEGTKFYFRVLLPVYEGECHIHVIANGDKSIAFDNQTEDKIMKAMKTTGGVGAYWARIVLKDGLLAQWTGNGTMQTNARGNFVPTTATADKFKDITLIRNFAEVTLKSVPSELSNVSYTLVNVPTTGSVAPVGSDNAYVDDYSNYDYDVTSEEMKSGDTVYKGYMVDPTIDSTVPAPGELPVVYGVDSGAYVYERPIATSQTTCLLMRGTFNGKVYYYRLDLLGESKPLALYRNYQYAITIGKVGGKGYSTPEEAMKHNSSDNISAMVEAKSLTDISDGSSRLYVEYIEKNYVTPGEHEFWVKYEPVAGGAVDNTKITISAPTGDAITSSTIEASRVSGDYQFFKFNVAEQGETDKVSTFVVKATNGKTGVDASMLTRTITVRVPKLVEMTLSLSNPTVSKTADAKTVLNIALADTLQKSMFPLEFYIEDTNHTLNPTGKDGSGKTVTVPVKVGKSIVDGTTDSFYFIRTVNLDEYEPMLKAWKAGDKNAIVFTTELKTLVADSTTDIYVTNEYFTKDSVKLTAE